MLSGLYSSIQFKLALRAHDRVVDEICRRPEPLGSALAGWAIGTTSAKIMGNGIPSTNL
jgi:hypothetical protein